MFAENTVTKYASLLLQYPEGYLEAQAAKEKEKENKNEAEEEETPTKGKRKRKSQGSGEFPGMRAMSDLRKPITSVEL